MRHLLLPLLLLAGCLKPAAIQQATSPTPVSVATLVELDRGLGDVPDELDAGIAKVLSKRNLTPKTLDLEPKFDELLGQPNSEGRVQLLVGEEVLLLVETSARFSVQVNGRYRWNVEADLSLVTDGFPEHARTRHASVPVALIYSHQGADDALIEATPLIARQAAALVDEWIASTP
ncbi:MAG: hypothetical protein KC912_20850 [Proteobacteria bacterium]|nr:hypothetical protein [Pseudomonadota bacterium]